MSLRAATLTLGYASPQAFDEWIQRVLPGV
jgi:hypothetical protein